MVFKTFYYYDFCPLQSISCISKVVLKRNILVLIPENHTHPNDTKQKKGHPPLAHENPATCILLPHWMGPHQKKGITALILAKKNFSGLAGSYFHLGSDFQQAVLTQSRHWEPAVQLVTHTWWCISTYLYPQLTGLSVEAGLPFLLQILKNQPCPFLIYTSMSLHLTTAHTFVRQKKHVIKLRDAHTLPFLLSLLLECHAR